MKILISVGRLLMRALRYILSRALRLTVVLQPRSEHTLTRYSMYEHFAKTATQISGRVHSPHRQLKVLSISGSTYLALKIFPDALIVDASYPEVSVLNLPFDDATFDAVVADQVLEHVEGNPFEVFKESCRVLKVGGVFVSASPFLYPIHAYPSDFWRFTPAGLSILARDCFSEVIEVGGWGNRYVGILAWLGLLHIKVPLAKWHPINKMATSNEECYPVVVWVVAQK